MALTITLSFREIVGDTDLGSVSRFAALDWSERINVSGDQAATFTAGIYDPTIARAVTDALTSTGNVEATIAIDGTTMAVFVVTALSFQHIPAVITVTGVDLAWLYNGVGIDRIKRYNTSVKDAATQIMAAGPPGLPGWANRASLTFTAQVANGANIPLSEDINSEYALPALQELADQIGGRLGPEYGATFADSVNRVIHIGLRAGGSVGTLTDVDIESLVETADVTGMASQFQIVGGSSQRGLPDSPIITSLDYVPGAGNVADVQFMLTVSAGDTEGGSYYLTPDKLAHPFSGNVGVTAACYDGVRSIHYLATPSGVMERYIYQGPGQYKLTTGDYVGVPLSQKRTPFTPRIVDVVVDQAQVFAFASGNQTGDGIWTYPYIFSAGETTVPLGHSSDYWKNLVGADVVCMTALNGTLYYVVSEAPTTVVAWRNFSSEAFDFEHAVFDYIEVPPDVAGGQAYAVTKLCRTAAGAGGVFVLTQGGSEGFYFITDGGTIAKSCNAAKSLEPTMINNVVGGGPGAAQNMALTNDGIWASDHAPSAGMVWYPLPDKNAPGLVGRQILFAATGDPGTAPDGVATPMVASDGQDVLDSQSNGRFWRGMLQTPVDVNTALRNGASPSPLTAQVLIDGEGEAVTHLINNQAPYAPGAALRFLDAPSLEANANYSHETISGVLLQDVIDFAPRAHQPQVQVIVSGVVRDGSSAYLVAAPLTKVAINYTGSGDCPDWAIGFAPYSATLTVLERHFTTQNLTLSCDLTLAILPVTRAPEFSPADTQYSISKLVRKP